MTAKEQNWIVRAPGPVERIEACFSGRAYALHRHDTYAIGVTLSGVQSFHYRGEARHSLPGQVLVIHPDELHDGYAGDNGMFRYRTAYISPCDFQKVLDGRELPFVSGGISDDPRLRAPVHALLNGSDDDDDLSWDDAIFDLVTAIEDVCGLSRKLGRANSQAATLARNYIDARLAHHLTLTELERVTGQGRWQLSRDFRAMFGTSPYRYLVLRRLDEARDLMMDGAAPSEAAFACGFADQSHLGRQFKQAFGLTPQAWVRAARSF